MSIFKPKKVLVGCSGGPDSTILLDKIRRSALYEPIAVHINYHYRDTANRDEEYVKRYANSFKLKLYVLDVNEEILNKYKHINNKEAKSREIRYDFFKQVGEKENTDMLFLAHHKDDFIETAIMQDERSKDLLFYGIAKKTSHHDLKIIRPLLKRRKTQLINECKKYHLPYGIDETNFDPKFERNKIRLNLMNLNSKSLNKIYKFFTRKNKSLSKKRSKLDKSYTKWSEDKFGVDFFLLASSDLHTNLIYRFLSKSGETVNITSGKLDSIVDFLRARNYSKEYIVAEDLVLKVNDKKLELSQK